ncbi:beta-glucosidase BglX [Sphingobium sufflavum]|nr:beta-glucosidase BglX [Sphingobium sufflavum]
MTSASSSGQVGQTRTKQPTAHAALSETEVAARADALLQQMTPEEKAGQLSVLFALPIPQMMAANEKLVASGNLGALLFMTDPAEINRVQKIAVEKTRLHIPLLFGFDVIHGLSTIFPVPIANAASWDPDGVEKSQAVAANEARSVGLHWTFAPMIDIARDPRWGRIVEGAGEDPYLGSAMAAAQVKGFQGGHIGDTGRIIAGPKHFVGYGAALGGRDYDEVNLSDSELWNIYLPPFKAAVDAGAGNIMSAYMGLNGVPASANHWLLNDVLRKDWGFKGFVVTDNAAVTSLRTHGVASTLQDAAATALNAGVDMEMNIMGPAFTRLPAALAAGTISEQRLNEAVRRVLEMKIRMGLFDNPYVDEKAAAATLRSPAHLKAARIAAERAAVLLRNEQALLPLDRTKLSSIAVIGGLADSPRDAVGPWVFDQNKPAMSSILEGIKAKVGPKVRVDFAPGVALPDRLHPSPFAQIVGKVTRPTPESGDTAGIAQAVQLARQSDVAILVLGETQEMIGESASRSTLDLPGRQQELLDAVVATGKPVVLVLMNGRPLALKDTKAAAILDIWYPGSEAGSSTANLLFGDAVPGGKLPFSWPRNGGQVPLIYSHLASHDPANQSKRYWNEAGDPAYPFGHGLSYSTFAYSNIRVDKAERAPGVAVTVSADVTNTGKRLADEVVQLYIHQQGGKAARPVRELKGFSRVTLKPGEKRTLNFTLGDAELRYWSSATRDWALDATRFDIAVGGDSTAPFTTSFSLAQGAR